jgi:hypothetical protein
LISSTDHTLRRIKIRPGLAAACASRRWARGWPARDAGRDPDSIAISAFGLPAREEAIAPFRDAGVDRAILAIADGSLDDIMRRLDRYAELIG